jgi:hypothetical protein
VKIGLEQLLASGALAQAAQGAESWNDVAKRLGMNIKSLHSARERWFHKHGTRLELADIRGAAARLESNPPPSGGLSSGPNLAAFDRDDDPPLAAIPAGHNVKGVSTLIGPGGEIKQQWIKTTAQDQQREHWLAAVRQICAELEPLVPAPAPVRCLEDLLTVYPFGDPHVGMLAWERDSGENFDLKIAEHRLVSAMAYLVEQSPASAEALLIFIGDNTHSDGQHNTTTRGTRVDVDGRTPKMMETVIRAARRSIDLALAKHQRVRVIVERGNHDELLSSMLALALSLLYEHEPRVSVDTSPEMFHWFRFGACLIGTHHGHNAKPEALLGVMATDRVADWSTTRHRRMYLGHFHHLITKEVPGMIVDYLPTLASSDAWHRGMGYRSAKLMYLDVLHREHGLIARSYVTPAMLAAA